MIASIYGQICITKLAYTYLMIKVQFRETNKKTNVGSLKTFQQFTDKVNKSFRDLPQELVYYYFDEDGDRIQIENQEDF